VRRSTFTPAPNVKKGGQLKASQTLNGGQKSGFVQIRRPPEGRRPG